MISIKNLVFSLFYIAAFVIAAIGATANAGADKTVFVGEATRLDGSLSTDFTYASQTNGTYSILWQTGDGFTCENLIKCPHAYLTPGTYTATLTVKNTAGQSSTDTVQITAVNIPAATGGNSVTLSDTGSPATNRTNLQAAVNTAAASPNTREILVPAGFVFNDPLILPARSATNYVTIRVADLSGLPEKVRVTNSASDKAKLFRMATYGTPTSGYNNGVEMAVNAKYYRIIGMEIRHLANEVNTDMIGSILSGNSTTQSHIIFDRILIDGNNFETRKGAALNGQFMSFLNSSILNIKAPGVETKAVANWTGAGPLIVFNNRLEAASINTLIGGSLMDSFADVLDGFAFRGNLSWKNPAWLGTGVAIKNQWELKQGYNSVADGNIFENNYEDGQSGEAILLKSMTDEGCAYCEVRWVDFRNNKILNTRAGFNVVNMQAFNLPYPPYARYIRFFNNFWEQTHGRNLIQGADDFEFNHNVFAPLAAQDNIYGFSHLQLTHGSTGVPESYKAVGHKNLNNIFLDGGSSTAIRCDHFNGTGALNDHLTGWDARKTIYTGASSGNHPADNFYPSEIKNDFVNYGAGNFRLKSNSIYKNAATDGTDVGLNVDLLESQTASAITGIWGDTVVPQLPTPAAPGFVSQDDAANTYVFSPTSGYAATLHEYSINGGAYQNAVSATIAVGNLAIPIGSLLVRVKAVAGVNNSGATRSNATAFTVSGGGNAGSTVIYFTGPNRPPVGN